jgi:hypothetical protein
LLRVSKIARRVSNKIKPQRIRQRLLSAPNHSHLFHEQAIAGLHLQAQQRRRGALELTAALASCYRGDEMLDSMEKLAI